MIECIGCGHRPAAGEPLPFACPRKGDPEVAGADHVYQLRPELAGLELPASGDLNPFIRYRRLSAIYQLARARGVADDRYVEIVSSLDERVHRVWGNGFQVTPYRRSDELGVYYKDETGNVGGSHKARHLMGIAVWLDVLDETGAAIDSELAIASCGNAAVAAAIIARAAERPLRVFIPPSASSEIQSRLAELGAETVICSRAEGDPPGDPCVAAFERAVAGGALPFACQGTANGLTIDGGKTLGYELAAQHSGGAWPPLSDLFIQVGGGALASAVWQALVDARELGALESLPRLRPVQTAGGYPMIRALEAIAGSAEALERGRRQRRDFMWPWETEPQSAARGILDDETYDWWQIARGVLESGGSGVAITEEQLAQGRERAVNAGISTSTTGAAGYAGALAADLPGESAVVFTGVGVGGASP